jgi:hypothetical protein
VHTDPNAFEAKVRADLLIMSSEISSPSSKHQCLR